MITSKQIIQVSEIYLTLVRPEYSKSPAAIYENPTSSDISNMNITAKKSGGEKLFGVRVVLDARQPQKVYVADDNSSCLHSDICSAIRVSGNEPFIYSGIETEPVNGKLRLLNYSMHRFTPEQFKYDWSFADKYILGFNDALKSGRWNPK